MKPRQPKKLMLAGDWHGNLPWAFKALNCAKYNGADTVLHVGDFGWWRDSHMTRTYLEEIQAELEHLDLILYWVDGNHEDHSRLAEMPNTPWCLGHLDRIVHLPRGYRWEWWGDIWMSLGGAYSVDRPFGVEGINWWQGETLTADQVEYATRHGKVDIIVAHDAPSGVDIPGIVDGKPLWLNVNGKPRQVPELDLWAARCHRTLVQGVCDVVKPKEFYHGHYHKAYTGLCRIQGGEYMAVRGLDKDNTTMAKNTHFIDSGIDDDD